MLVAVDRRLTTDIVPAVAYEGGTTRVVSFGPHVGSLSFGQWTGLVALDHLCLLN